MPTEIQIPSILLTAVQIIIAFVGAFALALWISLIIWTFRDARLRSRDIFAILLATLMVTIFGPLGLILYFLLRPPTTLAELYERSLEEEALLQDLEERPMCPTCSRQVNDVWVVCPDCHAALKKPCANCDRSLDLNWNICPFCGVHVTAADGGWENHDHRGEGEVVETVVAEAEVDEALFTRPTEVVRPAAEPLRPAEPLQPVEPPQSQAEAGASQQVTKPVAVGGDETRPQLPEAGPV